MYAMCTPCTYALYALYALYTFSVDIAQTAHFANVVSFTKLIQNPDHAAKLGQADTRSHSTSFAYSMNHASQYETVQNTHMHFQMC